MADEAPWRAGKIVWAPVVYAAGVITGPTAGEGVSAGVDAAGIVHLRGGCLKNNTGGAIAKGATLFTLPAGMSPAVVQEVSTTDSDNNSVILTIAIDGTVSCSLSSYVGLASPWQLTVSGITFPLT
jgi:hypothetical protein